MLALWYAFWDLLGWGGGPAAGFTVVARPGEAISHVLSSGNTSSAITGSSYTTVVSEAWA